MSIGVVIVTYNRIEKLKIALKSFEKQTLLPSYIVVVNNASTDKTVDFLKVWKEKETSFSKYVINLSENLGGSGGFYTGLKYAQTLNSDWIWVSDDDAFPDKDALKNAKRFLNKKYSAVCGAVINNGKIDLNHRRKLNFKWCKVISKDIPKKAYSQQKFELDSFSYVGTIINKQKLRMIGLPRKGYFIWMDDTEHSLRLRTVGKIICVPSVKIYHNTGKEQGVSWKTYYGIRNKADMYRRNLPKRYFLYFCYFGLLKVKINNLLGRHKQFNVLAKKAYIDALHGKQGLDSTYKPGWKSAEYKK